MDNLLGGRPGSDATLIQSNEVPKQPFRRLPNEIITDIFHFCLPVGHSLDGFPKLAEPLYSKPPLSLGRVCRDWRNISQNTPSLWSGILITEKNPSLYHIIIDVVKEWLARSQSSPLSIEVTAGFHNWRRPSKFPIHSIIQELTSRSTRWKHVSFDLGVIDFSLLAAFGHQLPELQTLRYSSTTNAPSGFNIANFKMAPRLSECLMTVGSLHIKYGSLMDRLQVLEILEPLDIGEFFNILDHCSGLIKFTLCERFISLPKMDVKELKTRSMLHLRVLDFWSASESTDNDTSTIWNFLHLPALKKFRYAASRAMPRAFLNIFSCLCRSQTDLYELYVMGFPINAQGFCTILSVSPNLRRLMFQCRDLSSTHAILKALTIDPRLPSVLCPRLQAFEISTYGSSDLSILIKMLLSRSPTALEAEKHLLKSTFRAVVKPLNKIYLQRPLRVINRQNPAQPLINIPQELCEKLPQDIKVIHDTKEELWNAYGSDIDLSGVNVEALSLISKTFCTTA